MKRIKALEQRIDTCMKLKKYAEATEKRKMVFNLSTDYAALSLNKNAEVYQQSLASSIQTL